MTEPTPDPRTSALLEQRLHDLAARAVPPAVPVADDVARGRRRVRRRRAVLGASALAAVLVVGGAAGLARSGPDDRAVDRTPVATSTPTPTPTPTTAPTTAPTTSTAPPAAPADPRDAQQLLTDWRDVVASYLDRRDQHLERVPSNVQSGSGLGTKLGWSQAGSDGLGMVQLFVSRTWADQWYMWCDSSQDCRDLTVRGPDGGEVAARVMEADGETWVGVQHDGFVVALMVDALFGNNAVVPVDGFDVSVRTLARVAADDRFSMPTAEQQAGVDRAFGWPG
ncbi:hypothetical protein [Nocardioides litoris]|uniref:hypothetical protein n=1 Tax=Nocardioides litoris TaxID=1926648 RepID=UPI00111DF7D4|nr:hypothetical protein [Nocardioides litoris]